MITKVNCLNNDCAEGSLTIGKEYVVIDEIEKISGKGVVSWLLCQRKVI